MKKVPKVILHFGITWGWARNILSGIAKYSHLHGPWALYSDRRSKEGPLPPLSNNLRADGIIAELKDAKMLQKVVPDGIPAIVMSTKEIIPGLPNIVGDNIGKAKMAAEHLLDRGFKRFAFCGLSDMYWSRERRKGFGKRIAKAGFETHVYERSKDKVKRSWEKEQISMANWLKSLPKPIGLMACDDERARDVIEACKVAGLYVPEEVAVVGVDNDELFCALSDPQMSSVAYNAETAGYKAAELLDTLMAGQKIMPHTDIRIQAQATHVVTRQSTDILAIEDKDVAQAVRFIREYAKEPIQVADVVDATVLSRRTLEQRFRKVLKRSVHDEIRRVRVEQIIKMLLETDMSISQIALDLGYPGINNLARFFRKEKHITPIAFRRKYGTK